MTSKHFEAFARAIAVITDETDALLVSQTIVGVAKDLNPRFDEDRFKDRITVLRTEVEGLNNPAIDSPTGIVLTFEQRKTMLYEELWELGHHELVEALGDHVLTHDPKLKDTQDTFDAMDEEDQTRTMLQIARAE